MPTDTQVLLEPVLELAKSASLRIMQIYTTAFTVVTKEDSSPLTTADTASNETINHGLQTLTPDIPVLSEESASVPFSERAEWQRFWLVDPLDGTKEFVGRNGEFTVNIALIENGEPRLGIVYVPVTGVAYYAACGAGAFRQDRAGVSHRISVQPVPHDGVVRVVGSRSHGGDKLAAFAKQLGEHSLIAVGSSLKLCLVAEGQADIYPRLGPTWEWDTAAAQCIVEEAGGQVVAATRDGQRLHYNKESLLNPHFLVFGDISRDWRTYLA